MLWMHRHTATTKSGQEGRRLLHQHDYRIFDFHLSESSTQQCFNDEMHVVFASAITNFVIFLLTNAHLSISYTSFFKNYYTAFMILGNTHVATVRLTILDRLVDIIDAPSNCIPAPNCTINRVNLLQSISYFPPLNVNATCSQSIYVSPEKGINCKYLLHSTQVHPL